MSIFLKARRKPGNRTVEVELPVGIQWTDPVEFDYSDFPLTIPFDISNKISAFIVIEILEAFDELIRLRNGDDSANIINELGSLVGRFSTPGAMAGWVGQIIDSDNVILKALADPPTEGTGKIRIGYFELT